jgi:hypothetical protein
LLNSIHIKVRGELGVKFNFIIPSLKFEEKIFFFYNWYFGLFPSSPVKPNCMRFGIQIDATLHAKVMLNYMQIGQDSSQLLHAL